MLLRFRTLPIVTLVCVVRLWASGPVYVAVTPAIQEYCHLIRFPETWRIPEVNEGGQALFYDYSDQYQFRVVGLLGTKFLVAGRVMLTDRRYYTFNKYQ